MRAVWALLALVVVVALVLAASCGKIPGASGPASAPTPLPTRHLGAGPRPTGPRQTTASPSPRPSAPPIAPAALTPVDRTAIALPDHVTPAPGLLHTDGTRVVDAAGRAVTLASVNWYGAEGPDYVPGGLDQLPYMRILLTIRALGFNSVRLPFSNELVERNPRVYEHLRANPGLVGKPALAIMDAILGGARRAGLMVILDDHRSDVGWTAQENGLWYTPAYPESAWVADWVALATRYKDNPAVVGVDLRDEPHTTSGVEVLGVGYLHNGATWGPFQGADNPATDWRLAAEQAGNAILAVNPRLLIVVEGTEIYPTKIAPTAAYCPGHADPAAGYCPDVYWWGGNLSGVTDYPVVLNVPHHLVYSAHEYGPQMHGQRWFTPTMTEADWQRQFARHWGDLLARTGPDAAPVWVGEFGTPHRSDLDVYNTRPVSQGQWFSALVHYIGQTHAGWAYWAINGTASGAPNRHYGAPDSFGLLTPDWRHVARPLLLKTLRAIQS